MQERIIVSDVTGSILSIQGFHKAVPRSGVILVGEFFLRGRRSAVFSGMGVFIQQSVHTDAGQPFTWTRGYCSHRLDVNGVTVKKAIPKIRLKPRRRSMFGLWNCNRLTERVLWRREEGFSDIKKTLGNA